MSDGEPTTPVLLDLPVSTAEDLTALTAESGGHAYYDTLADMALRAGIAAIRAYIRQCRAANTDPLHTLHHHEDSP